MYKCKVCNKEFETKQKLGGHGTVHTRVAKIKEQKKHKCKFCFEEFETGQILGGHIIRCEKRPDYVEFKKQHSERIGLASKKYIHTQETKNKISKARLKYLFENPDKVPYLMFHSSGESYPEKRFREEMVNNGIVGWVQEYQNGIYRYDFAFLELKIDVEIDGGTHSTEKVKKIDERRDMWSEGEGWIVLRFTAKEIKKDVNNCIKKLKVLLMKRKTYKQ